MAKNFISISESRHWTMVQWRAEIMDDLPTIALPLILFGALWFFWGAVRAPLNDALFRNDFGCEIAKQACALISDCSTMRFEVRYDRSEHEWERVARVTGKNLERERVIGAIEDALHSNTRSPIYNWAFSNIKVEFFN